MNQWLATWTLHLDDMMHAHGLVQQSKRRAAHARWKSKLMDNHMADAFLAAREPRPPAPEGVYVHGLGHVNDPTL
eukprot:3340714-Amphidinium_carterae.1